MEVIFNLTQEVVSLPAEIPDLATQFASPMMDAAELTYLAATLALAPRDPSAIVVEIGTYVGQTAIYMAKVLRLLGRRIPILSIDPFERVRPDPLNPQGHYGDYLENILRHHVEDVCMPLVAFSEQAAPVVPNRIAVLIVDGSHHYPDVQKDLALYCPKLVPGGLVFIDDYVEAYPGVRQAVDEYLTPDHPFQTLHRAWFVIARRLSL
ncbi:MAG: class I SAM-dependent methyltransferase [Acidobacteria bacterium]|nr:class I SAM-dependent methyltransferase [Acidobacteriota bacterium]MDW7983687.1 class I SAM-dependent methyltransferase [Acidobacteriota bacterium]